ncbi:MAG TPA: phosphatidylserine decarboxylase [Firmicutes bacterium]|nr:phosphatidylserine decarboxylase [Bacillota bacterium]
MLGGGYWYLRSVYFFRDPVRHPPDDPAAILAPCDGTVVYVKRLHGGVIEADKLGRAIPLPELHRSVHGFDAGWLIGIYMSPLDVHFNYAPVTASVNDVVHTPAATNLPMVDLWEYVNLTFLRRAVDLFAHRYHLVNERNTIFLRAEGRPPLAMVEIADKFVNKISCFVTAGDRVQAGQKVSFIARGSQVDLIIGEPEIEVLVQAGRHVTGAETVVARWRHEAI